MLCFRALVLSGPGVVRVGEPPQARLRALFCVVPVQAPRCWVLRSLCRGASLNSGNLGRGKPSQSPARFGRCPPPVLWARDPAGRRGLPPAGACNSPLTAAHRLGFVSRTQLTERGFAGGPPSLLSGAGGCNRATAFEILVPARRCSGAGQPFAAKLIALGPSLASSLPPSLFLRGCACLLWAPLTQALTRLAVLSLRSPCDVQLGHGAR